MPQEIYIILGSPNSPSGKLSAISLSRLNHCIINYKNDDLIICTGGWGSHFNTAEQSHAYFAKKYLLENGIPKDAFLEFALSSNTVDDAVKLRPILAQLKPAVYTVITSDYHLPRVQLIFNTILEKYDITYIGVASNLNTIDFKTLVDHEQRALQWIATNGLHFEPE